MVAVTDRAQPRERPILFSSPMVRAILDGRKTQTRHAVKLPHQNPLGQWEPLIVGGRGVYLDKAQTKPAPKMTAIWHTMTGDCVCCPYGQPGDRLWGRETFRSPAKGIVAYRADGRCGAWAGDGGGGRIWIHHGWLLNAPGRGEALGETYGETKYGDRWIPSIHMPRWASRITLEITDVRVERVCEISETDALAEGCEPRLSGTWWQGYREFGDDLIHQLHRGEAAPDWMIEPKQIKPTPWLDIPAKDSYRVLWDSINGLGSWDANPFVWVLTFRRIVA